MDGDISHRGRGRPKTGGRQKGTPNKPKQVAPADVAEIATKFPKYRIARTDSLVPYARNARTHSDAQISKIVASLKEYGFTNPVLTDGRRGIVAGHGRVLAAQKMGMETVPVIELSHLNAMQRRAYVIADNKLALESEWSEETLAMELGDLKESGFDLSLTGFDVGELDTLFDIDGLTDPDLPEPKPNPASAHTVVCPSCRHEFVVVI